MAANVIIQYDGTICDRLSKNRPFLHIPQIPFYCISVIHSNKKSGQPKFWPFVVNGRLAVGTVINLICTATIWEINYRCLDNRS